MRLACTAAESAFRLPAIAGKAGRYISTANGPISESRPSTMAARTIWAFITTLLLKVDKPSVGRSDDILGFLQRAPTLAVRRLGGLMALVFANHLSDHSRPIIEGIEYRQLQMEPSPIAHGCDAQCPQSQLCLARRPHIRARAAPACQSRQLGPSGCESTPSRRWHSWPAR